MHVLIFMFQVRLNLSSSLYKSHIVNIIKIIYIISNKQISLIIKYKGLKLFITLSSCSIIIKIKNPIETDFQ